MNAINKSLLPDEQILYKTKKHYIIFFFPALFTLITAILCARLPSVISAITPNNHALYSSLVTIGCGAPALIATFFWLKEWLNYLTSEFIVTSRRAIMKEGLFIRRSTETRLSAISHVNINQSILGQLLNYGVISINSFGGSKDDFEQLSSPFEFQKQVNAQLDKIIR